MAHIAWRFFLYRHHVHIVQHSSRRPPIKEQYTVKKRLASLVSHLPAAGDGKTANLFFTVYLKSCIWGMATRTSGWDVDM